MIADKATTFSTQWKAYNDTLLEGEGLSGLFLEVFEGVSNLRRKGLTVNPQFMTKKPLPTKPLGLRVSGRTTGSELPELGWFDLESPGGSHLGLKWACGFSPLKPVVWLLARLFGRMDVVLGPTPGYRPRPEEVPASLLSYKSSQVLVREKAALCRYQHGRGDPLMRFLWVPHNQDPQICHRRTRGTHTSLNKLNPSTWSDINWKEDWHFHALSCSVST